jgi:hypothetical protein
MLRREAGDREHFDGLVAKQGPERGRCRPRITQRECRNAYHPAFLVAEWTVSANEFADAMSATGTIE